MATTDLGKRIERRVASRARRASGRAAVKMQTELRRNFAPHKKSGDTQRATTVREDSFTASTITYLAKANTPQARYVNDGTRPHVIAPKANPGAPYDGLGKWPRFIRGEPLLVFPWARMGGRIVRFRWVDHPGYRGSGWWDFTIAQWHDFLVDAYAELPPDA